MERTASDAGKHLHSVGAILFDGAKTEAQHLTVIDRGLSESPSPEEWTAVLDYARENLGEGPLIDVQLTVAERIAGMSPPSSADSEPKRPLYQSDDEKANTVAMAQVLNTVDSLADSPYMLEDGTCRRMLRLVGQVRHTYGARYFRPDEAVAGLKPQPGERNRGMWASAAGSLIDAASQKLDNPKTRFWSAASRHLEDEASVIYAGRVSGLTVRIIDRVVDEADYPAEILGKEPYRAYIDEAAELKSAYDSRGYKDGQHQVDAIIDKAVSHIGVDSSGAVEALLDLHNDKQYLGYSRKESMLDRAIEITKASSRDPRMGYTRSRFLGFVRFHELTAQFEDRRALLESQLKKRFDHYVDNRPSAIKDILDLYDPSEDDKVQQLTGVLAEKLAGRAFTNGHYDPQTISNVPGEMKRLRRVIPEEIIDEAEERIRERLAKSTPVGSAAESA